MPFHNNTSLLIFMLHFVVGRIMHGYNTVEHSTTGANLIVLV